MLFLSTKKLTIVMSFTVSVIGLTLFSFDNDFAHALVKTKIKQLCERNLSKQTVPDKSLKLKNMVWQ